MTGTFFSHRNTPLFVLIFYETFLPVNDDYTLIGEYIEYFNTILGEYKVPYLDGTCDYITEDDFDGVQVIHL